jgi:hypothetical protein
MLKTKCNKNIKNSEHSSHIQHCKLCKHLIRIEKDNWNQLCKCGCKKIVKFKKQFYKKDCYYKWKHNDINLKNKISASVKKKYITDKDYKNRVSIGTKLGMLKSITWQNIIKNKKIYVKLTKEQKSKILKDRWNNPEYKNKMHIIMKLSAKKRKKFYSGFFKKMWSNRTLSERITIGEKISKTKALQISMGKIHPESNNKKYVHG